MSEPNSKFPKVSSCHGAPLRIASDFEGTNFYVCADLECQAPCDAVSDEGLDGKGYKNMPEKDKAEIVSNAVKGANEDQRKLVEGLEEKCDHPEDAQITLTPTFEDPHFVPCCLKCKKRLPPPDAKEEKEVMEQIIQKAYEGGLDRAEYSNLPSLLLKPLFWQCLGKALHWDGLIMEALDEEDFGKILSPNEWQEKWHLFIEHLIHGKTIESFFEQFLTPPTHDPK